MSNFIKKHKIVFKTAFTNIYLKNKTKKSSLAVTEKCAIGS